MQTNPPHSSMRGQMDKRTNCSMIVSTLMSCVMSSESKEGKINSQGEMWCHSVEQMFSREDLKLIHDGTKQL